MGVRTWLGRRHSLAAESGLIVVFYAVYEAARGFVAGDRSSAVHRAHEIVHLERALHVFAEPSVQRAAGDVPGLLALLGFAYVTLHLAVSGAVLLWLHTRRPALFPTVRTTLIVASVLSLIGFLAFPTAPPRMAGAGLQDSVSRNAVDLNHGLISAIYNPYAAVPSMHVAYALIAGIAVVAFARQRALRLIAAVYPAFVLLVIVATGNHFFFDAVAGAAVAAVSAAIAIGLQPRRRRVVVVPIPLEARREAAERAA
jgi:PAP2 superfamily protein